MNRQRDLMRVCLSFVQQWFEHIVYGETDMHTKGGECGDVVLPARTPPVAPPPVPSTSAHGGVLLQVSEADLSAVLALADTDGDGKVGLEVRHLGGGLGGG